VTDDVLRDILETADAWAESIVSNNASRISEFMRDDWVIVSETGISPKNHFLSMVSTGKLTHSSMQRVGEPLVHVHGDTAILTARVTNTAHFEGQQFDADEWTTDVFVRTDDKWLCALSHITPAQTD
jgi:ketosteroid isomerase-like protein